MRAERCREWRESLGAYALGQLGDEERIALEAHLEGCADCREEAESLAAIARMLPLADPAHFASAPAPPADLGEKVLAAVKEERRATRKRRSLRFGIPAAAAAAATAAVLAIFVFSGGESESGEHVHFTALPQGVHIGATLVSQPVGTEIHMYVKGMRWGTLCAVSLRGPGGESVSAGTFRYHGHESAVLTAALDLRRVEAVVVRAGRRTFVQQVEGGGETKSEEDQT